MLSRTGTERCVRTCFALISASLIASTAVFHAEAQSRTTPASSAPITSTGCLVEEATFARATGLARVDSSGDQMQLVLMDSSAGDAPRATFALTGSRERELAPHVNSMVEITGTPEGDTGRRQNAAPASGVAPPPNPRETRAPSSPQAPSADGRTPSGAAGITDRGGAAHEPGDAAAPLPGAGGEVPPNAASAASAPDQAIAVDDLPRINVTAYRVIGGGCGEQLARFAPPPAATGGAEQAAPAPQAPAQTAPAPARQVTITGCIVRGEAIARSPGAAPSTALLLTRTSLSDAAVATTGGAVPGSLPSGRGTGTVPSREQAGATVPTTADSQSFALEGPIERLAELADQRVSIDGSLRPAPADAREPSAHATSPTGTLVVASFRRIPGDCR